MRRQTSGTNTTMDEQPQLNLAHLLRKPEPRHGSNTSDSGSPGLLLLHGRGADEADLMGLEPALDPRFTVVSARAPFRLGPGFAWYGMDQIGKPDDSTLREALGVLHEFVQDLPAAYGLDPGRLYVMGFSQGAVMSAALAMTAPALVRGVVMHSGYVPSSSGLDVRPEALRDKPFFVAHGVYDEVIPVTFGRRSQEYLQEQGTRLVYNEYPIGHSISEESLYDFSEWLITELDAG